MPLEILCPCLDLQMLVMKQQDRENDLTDDLVDFPGILQSKVVLRRQAVEVGGPLHLVQVFLVF